MSLTPDGVRYFAAASQRVARPFHLRWLLPRLLGADSARWTWVTRTSVLAIGALTAVYAHSVWMVAVIALPGIWFNWRHPVLVDAPAMALALGAALLWPVCWPVAIALALVAGCVRETAPVWAAIYAWNPVLLVGLAPVAVRWLMRQGPDVLDEENAWILAHPFQASKKYHRGLWVDADTMVTPWGGLLAAVAFLDARLEVAIALAYAQIAAATDTVRLYQWAAPVLAASCVAGLPPWALPVVALTVVFNPWKGQGL
jgi:hypothetical protein